MMTSEDMVRLYFEEGLTYQEVAARAGLCVAATWERIQKICPRPPKDELNDAIQRWGIAGAAEEYEVSQATIKRWSGLPNQRHMEMVELYQRGCTIAELAARFGVSDGTMSKYLKRAGVKARPRGRRCNDEQL